MDNDKALDKVVEAVKNSNNVLITINRNPDVDQIAAAIALSFVLEKVEKFTTTIFSGPIPAAAEFLDPEKTFSSDMETLRDFVVSIHKDKVDRLRYKQEGDQVRIYLTPYRTTISQQDLEFENGNYNVDLVITIGTVTQEDMDSAIVGAIRILHDATVVAINTGGTVPSYATISWADPEEVAYCEMIADLAEILGENDVDEHTATALLTGIVSATDQFKNIKANPKVMQLAAKLMSFGANQQLISIKLEEGAKIDQQQKAPPPQPEQPRDVADNKDQLIQNISHNVEATTNAVNIINNDMAKNRAESDYRQISGEMEIHNKDEHMSHQQIISQSAELSPQMSPVPQQPGGDAPWPPKTEDMQHGRDYFDYYNSAQSSGEQPIAQSDSQPSTPVLDAAMPSMPMPPLPTEGSASNVMNDLAGYTPPEVQPPSLPQTEPTPGFFSSPTASEATVQPLVPQDITSHTFMGSDPSLDNPGGITPVPGDQQLSEDTASNDGPAPELAELGNIAAQATAEELSSDSGRASFNVSEELGSHQSPNPFLMQNMSGPEVNDPAAQLQQPVVPTPPQTEIPSNQFKIPGQ